MIIIMIIHFIYLLYLPFLQCIYYYTHLDHLYTNIKIELFQYKFNIMSLIANYINIITLIMRHRKPFIVILWT